MEKFGEGWVFLGDISEMFRPYLAKVGDEDTVKSTPKTGQDTIETVDLFQYTFAFIPLSIPLYPTFFLCYTYYNHVTPLISHATIYFYTLSFSGAAPTPEAVSFTIPMFSLMEAVGCQLTTFCD